MAVTLEQVSALHRYFLWADRMRVDADRMPAAAESQIDPAFHTHPYRSYYYAATYVVIEGWTDLGLSDAEVDGLLRVPYVDDLQRYRNGVFHYQRRYFDPRFLEFSSTPESAEWIGRLHGAFQRWFDNYIRELDEMEQEPNQ